MTLRNSNESTTKTTTTTTGCCGLDGHQRRSNRFAAPLNIGLAIVLLFHLQVIITPTVEAQFLDEGNECQLHDETWGVCRLSSECDWAAQRLRNGELNLRQLRNCGFTRDEPIICCADENEVLPRVATPVPPVPPVREPTYVDDVDDIVFLTTLASKLPLTTSPTHTSAIISATTAKPKPKASTTVQPSTSTKRTTIPTTTVLITYLRTAQVLTSAEILDINYELVPTSPRPTIPLPAFLGEQLRPTAAPLKHLAQLQLIPIDHKKPISTTSTTSITTPRSTTTARPTKASTAVLSTARTPSIVSVAPPTFWDVWSPHRQPKRVDIENNIVSHQHYDVVIRTTTAAPVSSVIPKTPTRTTSASTHPTPTKKPTTTTVASTPPTPPIKRIPQSTTETTLVIPPIVVPIVNNGIGDGSNIDSDGDGFSFPTSDSDDYAQLITTPRPTTSTSEIPVTTTTSETAAVTPRSSVQRPSDEACSKYRNLDFPSLDFHILGGFPTILGEFPHMAALGYPSQTVQQAAEFDFNCGGTIVSERWIMTAAHCVAREPPTVVRMGKITLLSDEDEADGLTLAIEEIVSYPAYVSNRNYDDIAMIRLVADIEFSHTIRPACLYSNPADLDPGLSLIVTGWGNNGNDTRSTVLLKTNLTALDLATCNDELTGYAKRPNRRFAAGLNEGHICAHAAGGMRDACQGDSGGPLQLVGPNDVSTVVGVVSFGIACGSTLPSVYTRVATYLAWIETMVWPPPRDG